MDLPHIHFDDLKNDFRQQFQRLSPPALYREAPTTRIVDSLCDETTVPGGHGKCFGQSHSNGSDTSHSSGCHVKGDPSER